MPRERFYVEIAPGYVRLRHQLSIRTKFGRGRLDPITAQVVRQLEDMEERGESIECGPPDPDDWAEIVAEQERQYLENLEAFIDDVGPEEAHRYFRGRGTRSGKEGSRGETGPGCQGNV